MEMGENLTISGNSHSLSIVISYENMYRVVPVSKDKESCYNSVVNIDCILLPSRETETAILHT